MYSLGVLPMDLIMRGLSFSFTIRSLSKSLMMTLKIFLNSPCVNLNHLNVSWKDTGSNSDMCLMGVIFQVLSFGRSRNICRNTHTHKLETTPVTNPLYYTISNRSWNLCGRPVIMKVVMNLRHEIIQRIIRIQPWVPAFRTRLMMHPGPVFRVFSKSCNFLRESQNSATFLPPIYTCVNFLHGTIFTWGHIFFCLYNVFCLKTKQSVNGGRNHPITENEQ